MGRSTGTLAVILTLTFLPMGIASAQGTPPEVVEMRRRVAAIRAELPAITAAAEDAADRLGRNPQSRLLVSKSWDASFASEMTYHGGGPFGIEDADGSSLRGLVLMPVRAWDRDALRASLFAERQLANNRITIVIGSTAGAPGIPVGQRRLDNGAPDGAVSRSSETALANNLVAWTFVVELVAAATRNGWHPGILRTSLMDDANALNAGITWRVNDTLATRRIPPGRLGSAYLDEVDRVLQVAGSPARVAIITRVATALSSIIGHGGKVYMASCMHWLSEELPRDSGAKGPVRGFDWRWDTEKILGDLTTPTDAVVWFGYGGTDCPHSQPSGAFRQLKRATVVVAGPETAKPEPDFLWIPQAWRLPDAAAPLPFPPGSMGPVATIEAAITWLWLKRLLAQP